MTPWFDLTLNGQRISFVPKRSAHTGLSATQYPRLIRFGSLRRPSSRSSALRESANMQVTLDNADGHLTQLFSQAYNAPAAAKYLDGTTVKTLFSGRVDRLDIGREIIIDWVGDGLSQTIPLRRATQLNRFASTDYMPVIFGQRVRMTPLRFSEDGREWLIAAHTITRIHSVEVDGLLVPREGWELSNRQDDQGLPISTLLLGQQVKDSIKLVVDGIADNAAGDLIENPAIIIWYLQSQLAKRQITRAEIDILRTATQDIKLRGVVDGSQRTLRDQIDEVMQSAGCIWSAGMPGFGRVWPVVLSANEPIYGILTEKIDSEPKSEFIKPVNRITILYDYDWADEQFTRSMELKSQQSINQYGEHTTDDGTLRLPWIGSDRMAELIGTRFLSYHARARYQAQWQWNDKNSVDMPPGVVWQSNHRLVN